MKQFMDRRRVEAFDHPLNSPDLVSEDFFLSPHLKRALKRMRFSDPVVQSKGTKVLHVTPKEVFVRSFQ